MSMSNVYNDSLAKIRQIESPTIDAIHEIIMPVFDQMYAAYEAEKQRCDDICDDPIDVQTEWGEFYL